MLDDGIDENFDMIYRNYFNAIDTKRNQFSCEFTYDEMTAFFHELKNLNELNELFSALKAYLSTNEPW